MAPERCQGSITSNCKGQNFQAVEENNGSVHTDYQEVTIQEAASQLGGAHVPRSLLVKLEHDLVDANRIALPQALQQVPTLVLLLVLAGKDEGIL